MVRTSNIQFIINRAGQPHIKGGRYFFLLMAFLVAIGPAAEEVGVRVARRQRLKLAEPLGQRLQLLRVFQLCLLFLGQGVIIRFAGGLKRLVDLHGLRIIHAVQRFRVRQSVDQRLHIGHGLLCGRVLLLFFLFRRLAFLLHFRRLALLLRFHRLILLLRFRRLALLLRFRRLAFLLRFRRLALLLHFRRLILLLRFPVCRVCRFLHGRGRLRRPLRLLCQRRRGQQRQAQGQRHETTQDTLLHRFPPLVFPRPDRVSTGREYPVGASPTGPGAPPGNFYRLTDPV